MDFAISPSKNNDICKLCNEYQYKYKCPKCSIEYCSMECYKSSAHLECSEMFYKQCVETELQAQQCDNQIKHNTLDILKKIYNDEIEDDILNNILEDNEEYSDEEYLDSDDENIPSLDKRLKDINLENADAVWSVLSSAEKEQFKCLIQSGEASKLLPSWKPWWTYSLKKQLVIDITEIEQNKIYKHACPNILNIPALHLDAKVSPFIKFSIINTIYAYAYSILFFNGEHHNTPLDCLCTFLRICNTIRINKVFKDSLSAIENVLLEVANCEALSGDQETIIATKEAGDAILNGPEEENKSFYVLAALSDLYSLLQEAKTEISNNSKPIDQKFKKKFQFIINDVEPKQISKKNLTLLLKKIEFYIAWLKSQSPNYNIIEYRAV